MKKNIFLRLAMVFVLAFTFACVAFGQDPTPVATIPTIPTDPASWFDTSRVEWVYGIVVVVGGYLSAFIPGLKSINTGVYRVLTWAVITGAGAVYLGSDIWGVAITYFMATGLYQIVLKQIIASPKPKDEYGRPVEGKIQPLIS